MKVIAIIVLLLATLLTISPSFAQGPNLKTITTIPGTSDIEGRKVLVDDQGTSYTLGQFTGTADLDPGPGTMLFTSSGDEDIFLQKLDDQGSLIWAISFGGSMFDDGTGLATDPNGNIYISGGFDGTVDFDPGPGIQSVTSAADADIFLLKINPSGAFQWVKTIPGGLNEYAEDVTVDAWGNILLIGNFEGTVDFDPGPGTAPLTSAGGYDIFVTKMDNAGNLLWARSFAGAGTSIEEGYSIGTDQYGNVVTTGGYIDSIDFDPGAGVAMRQSIGDNDIFLHKMDSAGNLLWVNSYGGWSEDYVFDLYIDTTGRSYLAGGFTDSIILDTSGAFVYGAGQEDALVMRVLANGNLDWWNTIGGPGFDVARCIAGDGVEYYTHVGGEFSGTANLAGQNNTPRMVSSNGDLDVFLVAFSEIGEIDNGIGFGGPGEDGAGGMAIRWGLLPYLTGKFSDSVDFDPGSGTLIKTSQGGFDGYTFALDILLHTDADPGGQEVIAFPNPTSDKISFDVQQIGQTGIWNLLDMQGKTIGKGKYDGGRFEIEMQTLPAGMYFLRARSRENTATLKVIRQ